MHLGCIACHSCAAVLRAHVIPLPHVPWAQSRRAAIMAHNKDPSQTWKRTINRFADRTDEERARVNGGGLVRALRGGSVVWGARVMCMPRTRQGRQGQVRGRGRGAQQQRPEQQH